MCGVSTPGSEQGEGDVEDDVPIPWREAFPDPDDDPDDAAEGT